MNAVMLDLDDVEEDDALAVPRFAEALDHYPYLIGTSSGSAWTVWEFLLLGSQY